MELAKNSENQQPKMCKFHLYAKCNGKCGREHPATVPTETQSRMREYISQYKICVPYLLFKKCKCTQTGSKHEQFKEVLSKVKLGKPSHVYTETKAQDEFDKKYKELSKRIDRLTRAVNNIRKKSLSPARADTVKVEVPQTPGIHAQDLSEQDMNCRNTRYFTILADIKSGDSSAMLSSRDELLAIMSKPNELKSFLSKRIEKLGDELDRIQENEHLFYENDRERIVEGLDECWDGKVDHYLDTIHAELFESNVDEEMPQRDQHIIASYINYRYLQLLALKSDEDNFKAIINNKIYTFQLLVNNEED